MTVLVTGWKFRAVVVFLVKNMYFGCPPKLKNFTHNWDVWQYQWNTQGLSSHLVMWCLLFPCRFDHVAALDILRIIVPDVVVFALSLSCVICSRGLIDSSPLRPEEPQRILNVPTNGSPWDNIMPYLIAVMLLVGGITLPSLPCVIYFVTFLVLATMWACHKAIPSQHSCFFKCIRVCLTIYSGCHLVALYLYQFQFFQDVLPPDHLVARSVQHYFSTSALKSFVESYKVDVDSHKVLMHLVTSVSFPVDKEV